MLTAAKAITHDCLQAVLIRIRRIVMSDNYSATSLQQLPLGTCNSGCCMEAAAIEKFHIAVKTTL